MKTRSTRRTATMAIAFGLALTVGGCTSPVTEELSDDATTSQEADDGATTAPDPADGEGSPDPSPTDDYEPSPFESLFNEAYGELTAGQYMSEQAMAEQIVAACMKDQGFEYVPVDTSAPSALEASGPRDPDAPRTDTLEAAMEFGYGISTWDVGASDPTGTDLEREDPNQQYVDSLSESAREAYGLALNGVPPTDEELASDDWVQDPADGGCYGRATEEVWNADEVWNAPQFASLVEEMSYVATDLDNDPEVTAASAGWSACMAQSGYPGLEAPWEAPDVIHVGLREIWEVGQTPDPEALAALREQELSIATADFTCAEEFRFVETYLDAQFRAEQEFIDSHRPELETLVEAIRAQRESATD